jgi:hypothetical protein
MLPALVDKGEYGYNVDDVSGYFHLHLTERSQEFFGFEWDGVYYVYIALNPSDSSIFFFRRWGPPTPPLPFVASFFS